MRYIRDVEQSKRLHSLKGPCVIISASGMAEAGRIQHHLKNNIEDSRNTVLIVGWQAPNTLGRRLVERTPVVRIFGKEYSLEAEVVTLNGFSNHADQPGLLGWAQAFKPPPERTFVVHGDPDAAAELATRLRQRFGFPGGDDSGPAPDRGNLKVGFVSRYTHSLGRLAATPHKS